MDSYQVRQYMLQVRFATKQTRELGPSSPEALRASSLPPAWCEGSRLGHQTRSHHPSRVDYAEVTCVYDAYQTQCLKHLDLGTRGSEEGRSDRRLRCQSQTHTHTPGSGHARRAQGIIVAAELRKVGW